MPSSDVTDPTPRISPTPSADERAYLYEVIQTIGSGPDLGSILSGVVRLATEATRCHACLIWFKEGDRLVLRACSAPYASLAGTLSMAVGEGLVGWVAKTRRSAFIREGALDDPRVRYFPEFEEEEFQSLVSVPVFGREGDVLGVISLHAEAPHEFVRDDLDFLEHTASLIAGAAENARLYEESTARVGLLTELSRLSRTVAAAGGIDELVSQVCAGTRKLFAASECRIYLRDQEGRLEMSTCDPPDASGTPADSLDLKLLMHDDRQADGLLPAHRLPGLVWDEPPEGTPMFAPLVAGDERLGLLAVLTSAPPPGAEIALSAIAAHAAVAIRQHELVERLLEKNLVADFFNALGRRDVGSDRVRRLATRLGVDFDAPHVIAFVESFDGGANGDAGASAAALWSDAVDRFDAAITARFPGAMLERTDRSVRILIPCADRTGRAIDEELRDTALRTGSGEALSIGLSDPCAGASAFPGGFEEAAAAAQIGRLLRPGPGCTTYHELGAYRYVLAQPDDQRDANQRRLFRLVEYDRRRGTALLDTLERYLDQRGNTVGTARALFVHPNTLRQRLERIETEAGLDFDSEDWLSLAIAVKAVRLRLLRSEDEGAVAGS